MEFSLARGAGLERLAQPVLELPLARGAGLERLAQPVLELPLARGAGLERLAQPVLELPLARGAGLERLAQPVLEFTSETTVDGVSTHYFTLGAVPGVLWTPPGPPTDRPLVLLVHGGGQHKEAPGVLARARRFVGLGWAAAAIDAPGCGDRPRDPQEAERFAALRARSAAGEAIGEAIGIDLARGNAERAAQAGPEWQATLDALQQAGNVGPVGIWGLSMGGAIAIALTATEPRIRAAVVGTAAPHESLTAAAARITVPVEYVVQWDDELIPREWSFGLFDAFASAEKSLQANPGPHQAVPHHRVDSDVLFLQRHLQSSTTM